MANSNTKRGQKRTAIFSMYIIMYASLYFMTRHFFHL